MEVVGLLLFGYASAYLIGGIVLVIVGAWIGHGLNKEYGGWIGAGITFLVLSVLLLKWWYVGERERDDKRNRYQIAKLAFNHLCAQENRSQIFRKVAGVQAVALSEEVSAADFAGVRRFIGASNFHEWLKGSGKNQTSGYQIVTDVSDTSSRYLVAIGEFGRPIEGTDHMLWGATISISDRKTNEILGRRNDYFFNGTTCNSSDDPSKKESAANALIFIHSVLEPSR